MAKTKRMSGEDRKAEITEAARGVFARKGFYGAGMREIAKAAKVSEALIYQHFPSKDALYEEIYFYIDPQIEELCNYFMPLWSTISARVKTWIFGWLSTLAIKSPTKAWTSLPSRVFISSLAKPPSCLLFSAR